MTQDPNLEYEKLKTPPADSLFTESGAGAEAVTTPAEQEITALPVEQTELYSSPDTPAESPVQTETLGSLQETLRKSKRPSTVVPPKKDSLAVQVEQIMEEGLQEAFKAMTPVQQQEFKIKGEETATNIRALLRKTHVQVKKIFKLILEWLKLIPGVNRFFLVQEAKIKADKIIALKHFDNLEK